MEPLDPAIVCDRAFEHWNAGREAAAEALFAQVLNVNPDYPAALEGAAVIAAFRGEADKARALIQRVLTAAPPTIETRLKFADILARAGAFDEAEGMARGLLAEQPDLPPAHYLLGQVLWGQGRLDEAFANYQRARLDLAPDLAGYLEYICHERLADCDWRGYAAQADFIRTRIRTGQASRQALTPLLMLDSPSDLLQSARIISRQYPVKPALWTGERYTHDKIRIGYLTAEIQDHPVGHLMAGVLEHYDRSAFELIAFSLGPRSDDKIARRLRAAFDKTHDLQHETDAAIAALIRASEIDILLHLNGHTLGARPGILSHRPAPVQVNYQGYPGTMGTAFADYLVADRAVIPEADAAYYTEKIAWLPDTYQPTDDRAPIGVAGGRAEAGLPAEGFVFMAYNHPNKIGPAIFERWMNILKRTAGAVLWLSPASPAAQENLSGEARARGVDPSRLVFAPRLDKRADHVARHRLADVFLDTLPFNAHSTASDALWAGLPVLTCRGTAFPGRVCAGLLTTAGLPELITQSLDDYEELAVALAHDPQRLASLRARVENDVPKSALFNTARYTRHLQQAFGAMHRIRQAGQPPRSFVVEAEA